MGVVTSVIIPVRNGARFITDAVTSVQSQLADGDQIIIIDDASTDDTRSVLSRINDTRIAVLDGTGRGVSSARNIGLGAARGDFIAFLDHDDIWPARRHEVLLRTLLDHPEYDAAFGRVRIRVEPEASSKMRERAMTLEGKHHAKFVVWTGLYRKALLERIGGFAEDMPFAEDTDYSLQLVETGMRWCLCDIDSLFYRVHGANVTNDFARIQSGQLMALARRIARARARKAG
jgi:glycosyltransferase involved in cell wall biosynthesis